MAADEDVAGPLTAQEAGARGAATLLRNKQLRKERLEKITARTTDLLWEMMTSNPRAFVFFPKAQLIALRVHEPAT